MKTKLQILQETADYYSADPSRRAITDGFCDYIADNGNKCAVGRCSRFSKKLFDIAGTANEVLETYSDKQFFKPEYQGHSIEFWRELQLFHDNDYLWTKTGLSSKGRRRLQALKKKYK